MTQGPDWQQSIVTGVAEVDVEHQLQVRLVESLQRAVATRQGRDTIGALLTQLADASNVHFMSEELLMRLHSWARYQAHVEEHRRLLEDLDALRALFDQGDDAGLQEGAGRVQAWLISHIRGMDRAFAEYVTKGGLGASPA